MKLVGQRDIYRPGQTWEKDGKRRTITHIYDMGLNQLRSSAERRPGNGYYVAWSTTQLWFWTRWEKWAEGAVLVSGDPA